MSQENVETCLLAGSGEVSHTFSVRTAARIVLLSVVMLVLGAVAYYAWLDWVVLRPGCGPYTCGWPVSFTWNHPGVVVGVFVAATGGVVLLTRRLLRQRLGPSSTDAHADS
jgi:hypothetical protein